MKSVPQRKLSNGFFEVISETLTSTAVKHQKLRAIIQKLTQLWPEMVYTYFHSFLQYKHVLQKKLPGTGCTRIHQNVDTIFTICLKSIFTHNLESQQKEWYPLYKLQFNSVRYSIEKDYSLSCVLNGAHVNTS